jgi:hypothetical protein
MQPTLSQRTISQVLADAFEIYRRNWTKLTAIAAIFIVPLTLLGHFIAHIVIVQAPSRAEVEARGLDAFPAGFWDAVLGAAVLGILTLLITQIVQGAVTRTVAGAVLDEPLEMGAAYRYGLTRLGSILLVGVLVSLAAMGGFLLLVIPGFIFLVRFSLSVPALVIEGTRGRAALSRSWKLTRGYGWHTFGALFVAAVLLSVATAILTAPFAQGWFGQAVAASVGSALTMPFAAMVAVVLYMDLRAREGQSDVRVVRSEFDAAGVPA